MDLTMEPNIDINLANGNTTSPQFNEVLEMIKAAKQKVFAAVNTSLIDLYWQIGCYISQQVEKSGWGKSVVEELANYIRTQEPNSEGFSKQNLWRMKQFYETYKDADEKLSALLREIAPKAESIFRDHYVMEFVGEQNGKPENTFRKTLIARMRDFILELGKDFIHIKDEFHLQVGNSDFRIDLLFYHRELQCLVAFELKTEKFKPEHLGQLNFYLEALDRDVKKPHENPSIGVLLCKSKDDEVVEYALSRSLSPTMVAEYELKLPDKALLQRKMQELAELIDDEQE